MEAKCDASGAGADKAAKHEGLPGYDAAVGMGPVSESRGVCGVAGGGEARGRARGVWPGVSPPSAVAPAAGDVEGGVEASDVVDWGGEVGSGPGGGMMQGGVGEGDSDVPQHGQQPDPTYAHVLTREGESKIVDAGLEMQHARRADAETGMREVCVCVCVCVFSVCVWMCVCACACVGQRLRLRLACLVRVRVCVRLRVRVYVRIYVRVYVRVRVRVRVRARRAEAGTRKVACVIGACACKRLRDDTLAHSLSRALSHTSSAGDARAYGPGRRIWRPRTSSLARLLAHTGNRC
jgi:hypothetical protein